MVVRSFMRQTRLRFSQIPLPTTLLVYGPVGRAAERKKVYGPGGSLQSSSLISASACKVMYGFVVVDYMCSSSLLLFGFQLALVGVVFAVV